MDSLKGMFYNVNLLPFLSILKHWKRRPLQLVLILVGLTTATALWNSVHLINSEAQKAYSDARILSEISPQQTVVPKIGLYFDDKYFSELRRRGWPLTPRIEGKITNVTLNKNEADIVLIGIDPLSAFQNKTLNAFPLDLRPEKFLRGSRVIVARQKTVKVLKNTDLIYTFIISNHFPEGFALTDISIAQKILQAENKITSLDVVGILPSELNQLTRRGLRLQLNDNEVDLSSLTKSFHLNLTAYGLLSYVVGLFIVYSTISLAFEQRKGILRSLRSLGLSVIALSTLMVVEVLLISLIAGNIGVILSYFLAAALLPDVAVTLNGLFGANLNKGLSLDPSFWISSLGISTFGAVCSSAPSLWKIGTLSPIEASKKIAWYIKTKSNLKYQLATVLALLISIVYFFKFGSGLISAFLLLGATLISATLLLPLFLWLLISLVLKYEFKNPIVHWFFADSKQQINSLSVSLMALLIALAINIGVGGMVESFRKTFIGWLDQRLVSELYVLAPDTEIAQKIETNLTNKVTAILPIVSVSQKVRDTSIEIFGFVPHQTYQDHWPLIKASKGVWEVLGREEGLIINEQLSRRLKLSVADMIDFKSSLGEDVSLKILGIYSDYGNPKGQVMLPYGLFKRYFPDVPRLRFAVRLSKEMIPQIKADLQSLSSKKKIIVTNQTEIKLLSTKIFDKTFSITTALSLLTLGIAGVALFTSTTALSDNRNSQIAPLWAIGIKQNTLAALEFFRALALSVLTFIFALPIGLCVVFLLTNYVNLEAFDWKLPIFYFPSQWLLLFILTVIMTCIATALHSIKLSRVSPSELLKASLYDT